MNCSSCGHENREDALFCEDCGARLERACGSCGTGNSPSAKFCRKCGASLSASSAPDRDPRDYTPRHLADKILRSKSALEGERKQVTVLFADVKGSMELAEQVDPEEWHRILDRFFQILADGVHRFEGTVNQYTGDGIMALFGAPIAHEDHAQRACYAALHLRDALRRYADELRVERGLNFSVRMGLNSGEVVVGKIGDDLRMDYTAQGQTVGLAARMEQIAESGRVYLSHHTARLVEGFFQLRDLGHARLQGASEAQRVHELEGVGPMRTRLEVSRARGFSRFVGRADEMATLEAALQRAGEGNGQVVGVVGEAGIGKSRLCLEFVEGCRAKGIEIHQAHCPAHGKTVPFLPLLELLRDLFGIADRDRDEQARRKIAGTLVLLDQAFQEALPLVFDFLGVGDPARPPPKIDPEARQRQLFGFVRRLVQTRGDRGPAVLLVDDVHWIDPGSDAFLVQLVEALSGTRTLLLLNFRPEYRADWMGKSCYQQLPLVPLGAEAIGELLEHLLGGHESLAGLPELIRARTGGNPFFIEEVVWSLVESGTLVGERGAYRLARPPAELEIPATVQSVLAARIDRLADREKQVLQAASVIGKRFSEPVLQRVIELPESDLAASLSALLGAEFIYQEALYPRAEYAFKHPLTQEVVYGSQLSERRARTHGAVARAIAADEPERLDERSALIAHHWEAAGEPLEAARWSRRAAEWAGFSDPAEALRHWRGVRRLAAEAPESAEAAALALAACVWILAFAWRVGISEDEVSTVFREGRRLAEASGDLRSLARICSSHGFYKVLAMEPAEEALALLDEAAGLAREVADSALTLRLAGEWTVSYRSIGRVREALRIAEEVVEQARGDPSVGDGIARLRAYSMLLCAKGMSLGDLARLEEGFRVAEEAHRLTRERGWDEVLFWATACLGRIAFLAGDAGRALHHAREAVELAERIGGSALRANGLMVLGMAHLAGRRWGEAKAAFERLIASGANRAIHIETLGFLAEARLGAGDRDGARAALDEALAFHGAWHLRARLNALLALARILLRTEGREAAERIEEALSEARRLAEEGGAAVWYPHIHVERAELARLRGDGAARERELREAHRLFEEMGATPRAEQVARELSADPA